MYKVILIILILIRGVNSQNLDITGKTSPFSLKSNLNGHWGWFGQNFSEYAVENPDGAGIILKHAHEFMFLPKDKILRFLSYHVQPHSTVEREDNGFKIWGPFYSMAFEAAHVINYR